MVQKYAQSASRLTDWIETNLPEGLTVFAFPESHRKKLRTHNTQEQLNREIGRRTDVVSIFPNEAACLRLVSAILMEQDEEWQTGRIYIAFETPPENLCRARRDMKTRTAFLKRAVPVSLGVR
jgi:putative transposase